MKLLILLFICAAFAFAEDNGQYEVDEEYEGDEDVTPFEAAFALYEVNGEIVNECRIIHVDCLQHAETPGERVKCYVQLGLCIGARLVGCSKQCVKPLVDCRINAGTDWPKLFHCASEFIRCVIGGCKHGLTEVKSNEEDDYSPFEAAIGLLEANGGILGECRQMHSDCLAAARTGFERIRCFIQLGLCVGAKAAGCSKQCVMPLIQCKIAAGDSWPAIFKCGSDFVQCVITGCKQEETLSCEGDECYSADEAAVEMFLSDVPAIDGGILDQCRMMHDECIAAASGIIQKGQCLVQLGLCLGAKLVSCSKDCIRPMIQCKLHNLGNFHGLIKCSIDFLKCAAGGCAGGKPGLETTVAANGGEVFDQCREMFHDCMHAADDLPHKAQCLTLMGLCVGAKIVECSKKCIAASLLCKSKAGGDFQKLMQCNVDFVKCAVGGCQKNETKETELFSDDTIKIKCRKFYDECALAADGVIEKGKCIVAFGMCITAKAIDCGKDCVAPALLCHAKSFKSFVKILKCNMDFVKCIVGGCRPHSDLAHTDDSLVEVDNTDGGIVDAKCKELYHDCSNSARTVIEKGRCIVQLGLCMGATLVECSKDCMAPMLLCKAKAIGDFSKLLHCNIEFVKCVVGGCRRNTTLPAVVYDEGIIAQCQDLYHDCTAAAKGIIQRAECVVQLGLCLAAKLVDCSKDCVAPMLMCKAKAIGNFKKLLQCNVDFIKCAAGGCANQSQAYFTESVTAIDKYAESLPSNEGFIDECHDLRRECVAAAKGFKQVMRCICQFTMCITAKVVECSKHCFAPLIMCKGEALGDWRKSMKCTIEFVKCAVGGCRKQSGVRELLSSMDPNDSELIKQCSIKRKKCAEAAKDIQGKVKCYLRFYFCAFDKLLTCGRDCLPTVGECLNEAAGDRKKTMQCIHNFARCLNDKCQKPSPVIQYEKGIMAQCHKLFGECNKAASGIIQRAECAVQLGLCLGAVLVDCAKQCVAPMIMCQAKGLGSFKKLIQCNIDFIRCASGGCANETAKNDDRIVIEATCRKMFEDCHATTSSIMQKARCLYQLKQCLGAKIVECSKDCITPMLQCKGKAGGDFTNLLQCNIAFVNCINGGCQGETSLEYSAPETALTTANGEAIIEECEDLQAECLAAAKHILDKAKCIMKFAICVSAKLVDCAKDCIAPVLMCKARAIGDLQKILECNKEFVRCAVGGCSKGPSTQTSLVLKMDKDDFSPYEVAISLLDGDEGTALSLNLKICKEGLAKCSKEVRGITDQGICFVKFAVCIGKEIVDCSATCIPEFALCKVNAGNDWIKTLLCATKLLYCAKRGCM